MATSTAIEEPLDDYFCDEEMNDIMSSLVPELEEIIPSGNKQYPCIFCSKICLSKGGLTRHKCTKYLDKLSLEEQAAKISSDKKRLPQNVLQPVATCFASSIASRRI